MTGRREGVAARLKRLNNNLISIHCVAHHLALAAGQASETSLKKYFVTCFISTIIRQFVKLV